MVELIKKVVGVSLNEEEGVAIANCLSQLVEEDACDVCKEYVKAYNLKFTVKVEEPVVVEEKEEESNKEEEKEEPIY